MNPVQKLIQLSQARRVRIAVIGDAMRDVYIHGHFGTCQEECYKFVEERSYIADGGAMNAAMQLMNWNVNASMFGPVDDVSVKTRFLVNGKFVFRHDCEQRPDFANVREEAMQDLIQFQPHAILLSDYDKGMLTPDFIQQVVAFAKEKNIPCVADAKRHPSIYEGCTLKANNDYRNQFGAINHALRPEDVLSVYSCDLKDIVFTDGPRSPVTFPESKRLPTHKTKCVNHVGAGDCFAAHLTLGLAHGLTLAESVEVAHSAAGVYVQHEHNRPPYPHEIARCIDPVGKVIAGESGKVIAGESGREVLDALRRSEAGRIVFTNGVFRVPHAGHAWLMRWAKAQGDTLVVGINDDASAARVKPGEYCLPLAERIEMLASMDAVDWIVPYSEDTPKKVCSDLKPNIMVKGNDYQGTRIPGEEYTKETRIAPPGPYEMLSVSEMVEQIKRN